MTIITRSNIAKFYLAIHLLSSAGISDAQEFEPPPPELRGATYTITLADGTKTVLTSDKFKLVKRIKSRSASNPPPLPPQIKTITRDRYITNRFELGIMAGVGRGTLKIDDEVDISVIRSPLDPAIGAYIGINITPSFGLLGIGTSNKTFMGGIKYSFGAM